MSPTRQQGLYVQQPLLPGFRPVVNFQTDYRDLIWEVRYDLLGKAA